MELPWTFRVGLSVEMRRRSRMGTSYGLKEDKVFNVSGMISYLYLIKGLHVQ